MYTKITCTIEREGGNGPLIYWVQDSFDTVFNHVYPITNPSSNLEAREHFEYTRHDGRRLALHPSMIGTFEEDPEGPDD